MGCGLCSHTVCRACAYENSEPLIPRYYCPLCYEPEREGLLQQTGEGTGEAIAGETAVQSLARDCFLHYRRIAALQSQAE